MSIACSAAAMPQSHSNAMPCHNRLAQAIQCTESSVDKLAHIGFILMNIECQCQGVPVDVLQ
eukprot:13879-Heterococcus_DN1.PRE.2